MADSVDSLLEDVRKHGEIVLTQDEIDRLYANLETKLSEAVADFAPDELAQMLDAAEVIRRARRS